MILPLYAVAETDAKLFQTVRVALYVVCKLERIVAWAESLASVVKPAMAGSCLR